MKLPLSNTKTGRVLAALMTGESYNLFEAALELHDRSLHSTVSTLQNNYGIKISRSYENVPGFEGRKIRCCRYWIDLDERIRILIEKYSGKEIALTSSEKTTVDGLETYDSDVKASGNDEQVSLLEMPVKYVRNCLKAIARF